MKPRRMKASIDGTPNFKVGDPLPDGYTARAEWAQVHLDAGLKQEKCCMCCKWYFPHELSGRTSVAQSMTSRGVRVYRSQRICKECDK